MGVAERPWLSAIGSLLFRNGCLSFSVPVANRDMPQIPFAAPLAAFVLVPARLCRVIYVLPRMWFERFDLLYNEKAATAQMTVATPIG